MQSDRFDLFFQTLYEVIPLLKKRFQLTHEQIEYGSVTNTHFPLLFALYSGGPLTMTETAKRLGLSKPRMTLQVETLFEEGLIERLTNREDRRLITIRLTERGGDFVKHLKALMKDKAWKVFSVLPDETLEKTLHALLTLKEVMADTEAESQRDKKTAAR
jgi:DNA-binding MarR family transcriptional regulator